MNGARLFHLLAPEDLARALASPDRTWAPPSLAAQGFVHLSFAQQVQGTVRVHFANARELVLLEVDRARVQDALVVEASRAGEAFPHLYRALALRECVRTWRLSARPAGSCDAPRFGAEPVADEPQGAEL